MCCSIWIASTAALTSRPRCSYSSRRSRTTRHATVRYARSHPGRPAPCVAPRAFVERLPGFIVTDYPDLSPRRPYGRALQEDREQHHAERHGMSRPRYASAGGSASTIDRLITAPFTRRVLQITSSTGTSRRDTHVLTSSVRDDALCRQHWRHALRRFLPEPDRRTNVASAEWRGCEAVANAHQRPGTLVTSIVATSICRRTLVIPLPVRPLHTGALHRVFSVERSVRCQVHETWIVARGVTSR